jgi:Icc protein
VIGNHDIWHRCVTGETPKSLALAAFGMPNRFYSWRMNGWKFIMLDVFGLSGAPLDAEQMAWLEKELPGEEPTCVVTHAPILSVTAILVGGGISGAKILRELFYRHPNVKLALSGHNHMLDTCTMDRVTYLCGGAVCGGWWEGDYQHHLPAFTILDLGPAGEVSPQMVLWEDK